MELFKKQIYGDAYNEIISNFKKIIDNNIPMTIYKTNYKGWANLIWEVENKTFDNNKKLILGLKTIKYGNLSYFISCHITYVKSPLILFELTDDSSDIPYTNDYYYISINKKKIELIKTNKKLNIDFNLFTTHYCNNCCDFAYTKDNDFVILTRNDVDNIYYLISFGKNTLFDNLGYIKKIDFYKEMKELYDNQIFKYKLADKKIIKKVANELIDALKNEDIKIITNLFEKKVNYTDINTYGIYEVNHITKFNELLQAKNILFTNISISLNEIMITFQIEQQDYKKKNLVYSFKVNKQYKICYFERIEPWLYGIKEFEN